MGGKEPRAHSTTLSDVEVTVTVALSLPTDKLEVGTPVMEAAPGPGGGAEPEAG
jgi:hypothetical protein